MSAMSRADLLVFTAHETVPGTAVAVGKFQEHPVFSATTSFSAFARKSDRGEVIHEPRTSAGPFYAFCGIGNPRAFFQDLKNWESYARRPKRISRTTIDMTHRDATELQAAARTAGAKALVTTEKDAQNLSGTQFSELPVYFAVIDLLISKEDVFLELIDAEARRRRRPRMKILIRATNWVGDAIMAMPALCAVRAKFPRRAYRHYCPTLCR